jgi:hypothetical protein
MRGQQDEPVHSASLEPLLHQVGDRRRAAAGEKITPRDRYLVVNIPKFVTHLFALAEATVL